MDIAFQKLSLLFHQPVEVFFQIFHRFLSNGCDFSHVLLLCELVVDVVLKCCTKLGIPNSSQSPDIEQNSGGGNSDSGCQVNPLEKKIITISEPVMILG